MAKTFCTCPNVDSALFSIDSSGLRCQTAGQSGGSTPVGLAQVKTVVPAKVEEEAAAGQVLAAGVRRVPTCQGERLAVITHTCVMSWFDMKREPFSRGQTGGEFGDGTVFSVGWGSGCSFFDGCTSRRFGAAQAAGFVCKYSGKGADGMLVSQGGVGWELQFAKR